MERKRKKLKQYDPPIVFTDSNIEQHLMEQMLKNLDTFGQKNIKKWFKKSAANHKWPNPPPFFKGLIEDNEDYEQLGGQGNAYA